MKLLLIRMAESGDVLAIGVPAIRYFKSIFPTAEISFLTYGDNAEFIKLAEPDVDILCLKQGDWPELLLPAMEKFIGLAEPIVERGFDRIINLDTAFMPCLLSRFLKDMGQYIEGNFTDISVPDLIDALHDNSLTADKVTEAEKYIKSTWLTFGQWFTEWWETDHPPEQGYPQYYLQRCCGYSTLALDMSIDLSVGELTSKKVTLFLGTNHLQSEKCVELTEFFEKMGICYQVLDEQLGIVKNLMKIAQSSLLVTVPSAFQWYAVATGVPSLLISGELDPRITMPEYATAKNDVVELGILANDIKQLLEWVHET